MTSVTGNSWAIAQWATSVPAAKAFLTDYYQVLPEAVKASTGYNQPVLKDLRKKRHYEKPSETRRRAKQRKQSAIRKGLALALAGGRRGGSGEQRRP